MSKFGFLCMTNYHLINIFNFVYNNCEDSYKNADLFLAFDEQKAVYLKNKLSKTGIFNNIYIVKNIKFKSNVIKRKLQSFYISLLGKRYFSKLLIDKQFVKKDYSVLCVASSTLLCEIFLRYFNKESIYYIEDGMGSYVGNIQENTMAFLYKLCAKIFKKGSKIDKLYVNNTKICNSLVTDNICLLPQNEDINYWKYLGEILDYKESNIFKKDDIVYLSQPVQLFGGEFVKLEKELLSNIEEKLQDRLILRSHPSEKEKMNNFKGRKDIVFNVWELDVKKHINETNVLVSICSTALMTPKILYNKEPYVVFLFAMFPFKKETYEIIMEFYETVKASYENKERVYAPKNLDELNEILEEITSKGI